MAVLCTYNMQIVQVFGVLTEIGINNKIDIERRIDKHDNKPNFEINPHNGEDLEDPVHPPALVQVEILAVQPHDRILDPTSAIRKVPYHRQGILSSTVCRQKDVILSRNRFTAERAISTLSLWYSSLVSKVEYTRILSPDLRKATK